MWKPKNIFTLNLHLKAYFEMEFADSQGDLMPEKALTSFNVCDAYHYFA